MCYPWNREGEGAPFRSCKRRSDCGSLSKEEGGSGEDGECFRHQDRRNVFTGICLDKRFGFIIQLGFKYVLCCRENMHCSEHSDCEEDLKCIKGFCGDTQYFKELQSFSCEVDFFCQVRTQHAGQSADICLT